MTKVNILGVGISRTSRPEVLGQFDRYLKDGRFHYVFASNVHTVMTSQADEEYRRIHNEADIALPDGKPLAWAARLLDGGPVERITGRELMALVCREGQKSGYSHFFYGGRESVLKELCRRLKTACPDLKVAGCYSPPFRRLTAEEDARAVRMMNDCHPDIVWVGLGAPKQEKWIGEHLGQVRAPVMVAVGAAFDFLAGNAKQAPLWMQKAGLEWLFRLGTDPRRLWRRYVLNNPKFLYLLCCQKLALRSYRIPDGHSGRV